MSEIPSTPRRLSRAPSSIPSPEHVGTDSNIHKRRYTRTPSPKPALTRLTTNDRLSLDGKNHQLLKNTQPSSSSSAESSHISSFYKQNIVELNELQEQLFQKKAKLDTLRDQLAASKDEHRDIQFKWEKLHEDKISSQQQLKLKENELIKLKESIKARRKFLEDGHKLHLQQLEVDNKAEINKMENEFRIKIENLKQTKIKKFEEDRDALAKKVHDLETKISTNDETVRETLKEVDNKYDKIREDWLQEYQEDWKKKMELNENYIKENEKLTSEIEKVLEPKAEQQKLKLEKLTEKYNDLKNLLADREKENAELKESIAKRREETEEIKNRRKSLQDYIDKTENDLKEINEILTKEETIRRTLHNELQELRGNIRVYCRIRPPLLPHEDPDTSHVKVNDFDDDNGIQTMEITKAKSTTGLSNVAQKFKFDKIFEQQESNNEVFKEVGQLVQSSLDGYNVCIFAYGQTGSGKTYTMLNPKDGIIPSTITHIFSWINNLKERGWNYDIECQFVEIYNENIVDLLRGNDPDHEQNSSLKHEIRHDHENQTTMITNVTTCKLDSEETVEKLLKKANKLRSTASTKSNEHSSRSHSIFIIHLYGTNEKTKESSYGILNLVDLAGSERINSSQVTGERLRETQNINRSLSCLGDVIHALNGPDKNGKRHIPFRNSKLTYLLQYSLLGNSKTLMFVNISPSTNHLNETLNSLRFASKVNSTKMSARS